MIFARKMPEFYVIIARKIFFPNFSGAHAPPPAPPSPTPICMITYLIVCVHENSCRTGMAGRCNRLSIPVYSFLFHVYLGYMYLGDAHCRRVESIRLPTNVFPRQVTFTTRIPAQCIFTCIYNIPGSPGWITVWLIIRILTQARTQGSLGGTKTNNSQKYTRKVHTVCTLKFSLD